MGYRSLRECLIDLEKHGHLRRVTEEVDPHLEMAAIHHRVYEKQGPALWFTNVKGSKFTAASNLFGTLDRSKFMFRDTYDEVKKLIELKANPFEAFKKLPRYWKAPFTAVKALPSKAWFSKPIQFATCRIEDVPLIRHWPMDGGAFVTLPIVYTEDIEKPGVMNSNIGMYRIQLNGNDYKLNEEIGLHYQLHRGIGVHQTKSNKKGLPLKVSIFVGGPPSHTLSAVMPLPEGLSELTFAGALGNRRFRYFYNEDGFCISADADFVITGEVFPGENKPEGPFGDHLGYYSLTHDFPLMRVKKVYHRRDAIWPFTVVGRPPQEDTSFGALIHDLTGPVIPTEIPGLHAVHAVDAAGVHPLLLAIGSERYTPYLQEKKPQEILTIANHILGFGQMSLAKFLFIISKEDNPQLDIHDIRGYYMHVLERVDWTRDVHFYTKTSMDTLDYSGESLNSGSKVVIAAAGDKKRDLPELLPSNVQVEGNFAEPVVVMPGILAIKGPKFSNYHNAESELKNLENQLQRFKELADQFPLIILCDDSHFVAAHINNFLWVSFTRSNPSHDIYGVDSFHEFKHWGCRGSLIIDARIKPHHAPPVEKDPDVEQRIDRIFAKGGSLFGV
ncbi:MAG: UbiD family decarboxylase [Flavobacteriales bacterium]